MVLRLGSHAEKRYFLKTIQLWDGLIVGSNLLEATPGATSSLIMKFAGAKHKVPYYIDPMTYAFGTYVERKTDRLRTDLDWIKSEQKVRGSNTTERRFKRSYRRLAERLGGSVIRAIETNEALSANLLDETNQIENMCSAVLNYQRSRISSEISSWPEFEADTEVIPGPAALFAPYFYIDCHHLDAGLSLFSACARISASMAANEQVHCVLCTDVSRLDSPEFLEKAATLILDSGVDGVWLWFSRYYEETASVSRLRAFRKLVEKLSETVDVYNRHGGKFSLALSRCGLRGTSHGVGYGEQKDVMPVIGQSTPTVRYYLPDLGRRLGVPEIERALPGIGVRTAEDFLDSVCRCPICRQVIGPDGGGFSSYGDFRYSSPETKRQTQAPAAAQRCRFHFLLNRAMERDWFQTADIRTICKLFEKAFRKWASEPTLSGDARHLPRWKKVLAERI